MTRQTPILPCRDHASITVSPSPSPFHPLQSPQYTIPASLAPHIDTATKHLKAGLTVAVPTETVYGLAADSTTPSAVERIYRIKNRPSDNPLIIHVSSLDMLSRLLPPSYTHSKLYMALMTAFWPGPLTLLLPSANPPPPPAPQTNAIRMPAHPLALALISHANLPLSAPSANSSGRPSPTTAQHVANDLDGKEGLGCILDGGPCGVGVESTVVDGLAWGEGGNVNILRPGGLGVEDIARVVHEVDGEVGRTEILVHGRPWQPNAKAGPSRNHSGDSMVRKAIAQLANGDSTRRSTNGSSPPPATPGQKYRHYSPRVPVHLLLPSNAFPRPLHSTAPDNPHPGAPDDYVDSDGVSTLLSRLNKRYAQDAGRALLGILHFEDSPLHRALVPFEEDGEANGVKLTLVSLGPDAQSAAQKLFSSMLELEGGQSVDAILIEGCRDEGLGLAVMERVGKAVGGGGISGTLANGETNPANGDDSHGRFWVKV